MRVPSVAAAVGLIGSEEPVRKHRGQVIVSQEGKERTVVPE